MTNLLTRQEFREKVFERDHNTCVFCSEPAIDVHHIMERRLWSDGGYYINNGASVCQQHHIECEKTLITTEQIRHQCKIQKVLLPEHLYDDEIYDKWGNPYLKNGLRLRGELFFDESVQKILKDVLDQFTNRVKYPRTYHLTWSNVPKDDKKIRNCDNFIGKRVIVTTKQDGENTTCYNDYIHARSIENQNHPSRDWMKNFWASFKQDIPEDWRICGENLFATHSIHYTNLQSYFEGFSIWNNMNICLNWDETLEWFSLLNIKSVPVIYDGIFDENKIKLLYNETTDWNTCEGYVVRLADSFPYNQFRNCVAKYVRKNHVQTTHKHWRLGQFEVNGLQDHDNIPP